ncbi:hypothetical protein ACN47E_002838 [Coniothyrium glycines]
MTAFKFPPPPPPSKPTVQSTQPSPSPGGGHNRGGGDRGRGRGGNQHRGAAFHSSSGGSRGGHGQGSGRGNTRGRGGPRGGQNNGRGGGNQQRGTNAGQTHQQPPQLHTDQAKVYVNPAFVGSSSTLGQTQPQVDPNALAQVMSFMSTPAGVHSMAAFANHMTSTVNPTPQQLGSMQPQLSPVSTKSSLPYHAAQKRKLDDRKEVAHTKQQQQPSSKPPRAKAAVPPQVPSFGFSLPNPAVVRPSKTSQINGKNDSKKRKLNLGLTSDKHDIAHESSDEEDVDEEAAYAQRLKGGGFIFEHEGEQISIQTDVEVAAWVKDRRKNFPTQKRIIERAEQAAIKRHDELEFLRRINGKPSRTLQEDMTEKPGRSKPPDRDSRHDEDDRKKQEELAALRKRLHESMLEKRHAPTTVDLGLGYDSDTDSHARSSVLSDSSVVSSSEESLEESESESGSDAESDAETKAEQEAPEPVSSKVGPPPIKVPPPVKMSPQASDMKQRICPSWAEKGRCRYSNKCKFDHPRKEESRISLYDRMVEQELVKVDQLALDAIKYLGQNGCLG